MNSKVCYFCCFYLGDRRSTPKIYDEDRLIFLKEQIKTLELFNHNLSKIIFVFNLDVNHIDVFQEAKKIIPKKIQNSEVKIIYTKMCSFFEIWFLYTDLCSNFKFKNLNTNALSTIFRLLLLRGPFFNRGYVRSSVF